MYLVMAVVGLVGAGMGVVVYERAGLSQGGGRTPEMSEHFPRVTPLTPPSRCIALGVVVSRVWWSWLVVM